MKLSYILICFCVALGFTNFVGNVATVIPMIAASIAIFFTDGLRGFGGKGLPYLLLFYFVVIIYAFIGFGNLNEITFRGWLFNAINIICIFIISNHLKRFSSKQTQNLVIISLIAFLLCSLITLSIAAANPMALRIYGMGEITEGVSEGNLYRSMGMMSYAGAHSIVAFATGVAVLLMYCKTKFIRIGSLVLLLLMIMLMFVMTITTALLLTVISIMTILAFKLSKGRVSVAIGILCVAGIVFLSSSAIINILGYAEGSNTEIFAKLNDLYATIQTGSGTGQMGYREDLYSTSFNSFLSNPIFGGAIDDGSRRSIGQHSFMMDSLAFFGIFGIIYFLSIWIEYRSAYHPNNKKNSILYSLAIIPSFILMFLKAESVCSQLPLTLLIFIPLVFRMVFNKPDKQIKTLSKGMA